MTVDYASHPLETSQQVLRRPGGPVSLSMAPHPPENSPQVLRKGSYQHRRRPICPEAKVLILKRLETPVSLDSAPTFFLRLTTGPDRLGTSVCMEHPHIS